MKRILLFLPLLLASCADFERGFMESYNRVNSAPLVAYDAPEPLAVEQPPSQQPDYTIHSALVTQMGQPPKIITYNQNSALVTQMGQAPIIISGY